MRSVKPQNYDRLGQACVQSEKYCIVINSRFRHHLQKSTNNSGLRDFFALSQRFAGNRDPRKLCEQIETTRRTLPLINEIARLVKFGGNFARLLVLEGSFATFTGNFHEQIMQSLHQRQAERTSDRSCYNYKKNHKHLPVVKKKTHQVDRF